MQAGEQNDAAAARVMLVEDDSTDAKVARLALAGIGYEIIAHMDNAETAVREAGEHKPDLVLMDIHLAGEMDGLEAAERIWDRFGIPVVMLTAASSQDLLIRSRKAEPFAYLLKPYTKASLRVALDTALNRHRLYRDLQASEQRFKEAFLSANVGMALAGANGSLLQANPMLCAMLGKDADEILKAGVAGLFSQQGKREMTRLFQEIMEGRRNQAEAVVELAKADGESLSAQLSLKAAAGSGDTPAFVITYLLDLSDRERAAQALEEKLKLQGAMELAGAACHELNQPLQVLSSRLEILSAKLKASGQEASESLKPLEEEVARLVAITRRLSNITTYRTMEYLPGTRIFDLKNSSQEQD